MAVNIPTTRPSLAQMGPFAMGPDAVRNKFLTAKNFPRNVFFKTTKRGYVDILIYLSSSIELACATVEKNWKYRYHRRSYQMYYNDIMWSKGTTGIPDDVTGPGGMPVHPPIHKYIQEEFYNQRSNFPPKSYPYRDRYPEQLVQYGNLESAVNKMGNNPQFALFKSKYIGDTTFAMRLDIGRYFGDFFRKLGPRKGVGIGYVWLHEFGLGVPKRSFIIPALARAGKDWERAWGSTVFAAQYILEKPEKAGIKPIVTVVKSPGMVVPGVPATSTASSIIHRFPARHSNIFQLLLWLLPTHRYIAILAAMKDIRGAIRGTRLSAGSIQQWLESLVLGSSGMTVKARRRSFRKKLWS